MRIERINDFESLQKRADEWNRLLFFSGQNYIFLTHEWFTSWWKCFSKNISLEILIFKEKNGSLYGVAPLMVKDQILRFIGSQEVSDYCDVVTIREKREEFYESLLDYFRMNYSNIKKIELMNIKSSSPTLTYIPRIAAEHGFSCLVFETEVAPVLDLPSSYEDYMASLNKKMRHEIRRKLRRVESLGDIKIMKITEIRKLQFFIEVFIALHKESGPSKKEFWVREGMSDFFREVVYRFSLKKWVELNLLFYGEKIMAALLNFSYSNQIYFYNVAFNRDFAWYSPGIFLFNSCIKEAISEKKRKADFLRGREKYKYYFGAKESKMYKLSLTSGLNKE